MPAYADMTTEELAAKRDELMREYKAIKTKGLASEHGARQALKRAA